MTYRHKRTGGVVNTPCRIEGPDWEELTEAKAEEPEKAPAQKPAHKRKAKASS